MAAMDPSRAHDWAFFQWAAAGFLVVFGFITGFTIGLPFLVVGVLLLVRLYRRRPAWPADLGALAGAGLVCLVIALISAISGDLSPVVWATVGLVLSAGASATFWWLRCRPSVA
jgi:uncharacterized membrane protein